MKLKGLHFWKHNLRGRSLIIAITACSCQAFLLLGYDQGNNVSTLIARSGLYADFFFILIQE